MLEVDGLTAYYGDFQALFGLGFQVRAAEVVALLGGNGAGKTSCLRVISGLLHPRTGRVRFLGQDITERSPAEIVDLGIAHVPEGRQLFPEMSVEENLWLGSYSTNRPSACPRSSPSRRWPRCASWPRW